MIQRLLCGVICSLAVVAAAHAIDEAVPPWAAKSPDGSPVRIAIPAPEDDRFAHLAWPKAARTSDGTIIVAYIASAAHGSGGCPAVSISTDNGRTFTAPHILKEFGKGNEYTNSGNLGVAVAEDGAVVVLAMAQNGEKASNIYGWRSNDTGKSWKTVDTSALGPNITGSVTSIISVKNVGLMAAGHYRGGSNPSTGASISTSVDNGRSWGKPVTVTTLNAGEPFLLQADGRLLIFLRSRTVKKAQQYLCVSSDMGKTWSVDLTDMMAQSPTGNKLTHPCAILNPENPEEILAITTERPVPGQTWLWRGDVKTLAFKPDRVLLDFPKIEGNLNTDFGYTTVVPNGKGKLLMFYYHGLQKGDSHIWATDITY